MEFPLALSSELQACKHGEVVASTLKCLRSRFAIEGGIEGYPNPQTDAIGYDRPAFLDSGISDATVELPASAEEMREQIRHTRSDSPVQEQLETSAAKAGMMLVDFIACRHFRVPMDPAFWQRQLTDAEPPVPSPVPKGSA